MGHSFVKFRDRMELMPDSDVIIIVHVILDVSRKDSNSVQLTDNVKALLDYWNSLLDVYGPGCLRLNLDKFILTEADRKSLLGLVRSAKNTIESFGSTVSVSYLNNIVDAPAILEFYDRPTAEVLVAFDKFTELFKDEP